MCGDVFSTNSAGWHPYMTPMMKEALRKMNNQCVTITYGIVNSHGEKLTYASDINSREDAYKLVLKELPSMLKPLHVMVEGPEPGEVHKFRLDPYEYTVQFLRTMEKRTVLEMKESLKRLWEALEEHDA